MKTSTVALGIGWLLLASPVSAADLAALERTVLAEDGRRRELVAERTALAQQAGALAEAITRAKQTARGPRAGPDLERLLRDFEKLADRLDRLEGEMAKAQARRQRAVERFDEAAERDTQRLGREGSSPETVARGLAEIEAARGRVGALQESPPLFRPGLEVVVEETDGPEELELKAEVLRGERLRFEQERRRLESEQRLLSARVELKLELQRELELARRDTRLDLRLVRSQAERLRRQVEDLRRQQRNNEDQRRRLGSAVEEIDEGLAAIEERLATLFRGPSTGY